MLINHIKSDALIARKARKTDGNITYNSIF